MKIILQPHVHVYDCVPGYLVRSRGEGPAQFALVQKNPAITSRIYPEIGRFAEDKFATPN